MPAITITDLNNAKLDVDHIAEIATSLSDTSTDRLGNTKNTIAHAIELIDADVSIIDNLRVSGVNSINADVLAVSDRADQALTSDIPAAIASLTVMNNRGPWVTATAYTYQDIVSDSGSWYICVVPHTSSGVFATDAATKWRLYQGVTTGDLSASSGSGLVGYSQASFYSYGTLGRKLQEFVSVKDFGAQGNGGGDDTSAIELAFAYASTLTNPQIYFPPGIYPVSSTISFTGDNWGIIGAGKSLVTLLAIADVNIFEIDVSTTTARYGQIKGICFKRENVSYANTKAIYVKSTAIDSSGLRHWTFSDLRFFGVEYGIYFDNAGNYATSLGASIVGGHGFNSFENLEVPVELNARYPYATVRWAGAVGPHERIIGGYFRSRYASVMIGSGVPNQIQGDFLMSNVHCVLGDYGIEILGPTNIEAYRYNFSITNCQFDVLNIAVLKADHIGLLRFIGNNMSGMGCLLTNMNGYVLDNDLNHSYVEPAAGRTFDLDTTLTLGKVVTHNGTRFIENGYLSIGSGSTKTIAVGVITVDRTYTIVDTESAAATDDLDTINGGATGDIIIIRSANSARTVVVKHNTGNIRLDGSTNKSLTSVSCRLVLVREGSTWVQMSFSSQ